MPHHVGLFPAEDSRDCAYAIQTKGVRLYYSAFVCTKPNLVGLFAAEEQGNCVYTTESV